MAIISIPTSIGGINIPGGLLGGPLGSLYTVDGLEYVKYPRDLESATRSHVVFFTINEIQEVTLQEAVDTTTDVVGNLASGGLSAIKNAYNDPTGTFQAAKEYANKAGDFLSGISTSTFTDAGNKLNTIKENFTTQKTTPKAYIALYMPETMNFTYSADYDDSVTLASAAGATPVIGGVVSKLTGILEGNPLARLALNKAGYVFNPNKQLLFNGINFREFQMSFTFTPYSRDEKEAVNKIIKLFRSYAAPTIVTEGAGMFFKPPAIFDVEFKFNGSENQNIPKFKRSVVRNVDVNYAPNGWATHDDGSPVQTTITIDFQEMVLIDKKAIESGY